MKTYEKITVFYFKDAAIWLPCIAVQPSEQGGGFAGN